MSGLNANQSLSTTEDNAVSALLRVPASPDPDTDLEIAEGFGVGEDAPRQRTTKTKSRVVELEGNDDDDDDIGDALGWERKQDNLLKDGAKKAQAKMVSAKSKPSAVAKASSQNDATKDRVGTPHWSIEKMAVKEKIMEEKQAKAKKAREDKIREDEIAQQRRKEEAAKRSKGRERKALLLSKFTANELEELKEAFGEADSDSSGSIDEDELAMVVIKLGGKLASEEIIKLLKEMDTDGDGAVDFHEFLEFMVTMKTDPVTGRRSKTFMNHLENKIAKVEERRQRLAEDTLKKRAAKLAQAEKVRQEKYKRAEEAKRQRKLEIIERNEINEMKKAMRLKEERAKAAREVDNRLKLIEEKKQASQERSRAIERRKRAIEQEHQRHKREEILQKKKKREELKERQKQETMAKARKLQENRERREKKAALLKKFTKTELTTLRQLFEKYDTDRSGNIDASELMEILTSLGDTHTEEDVMELIGTINTVTEGELTFHEFLLLSDKLKHGVGGVRTSFLSLSLKQKEIAKKRRDDNHAEKEAEARALKERLDLDRDSTLNE